MVKKVKINWHDVYKSFPINKNMIWLNNCGTTPPGKQIVNEMKSFLENYLEEGIFVKNFFYKDVLSSIRKILSEILNCGPEEVALLQNTAEGMNLISRGLSLNPEDSILLLEYEYPSNVYPWQHWEKKNIKLETIKLADNPEEFIENVKKKITPSVKVMTLSMVHWCTGMPLPIKEISAICKENNILLIIDGAQGVGHINSDIKELGIDIMCFSAWKWLFGPIGLGCMIITNDNIKHISPVFKGPGSIRHSDNYFPYSDDLKPSAGRFMYSTSSFNDWVHFNASLKYLKSLGFENIKDRIFELSEYLARGLKQLDFKLAYDFISNNDLPKTGIVVAKKEGLDNKKIIHSLSENKIIVREKLGGIRFAPHIYNSTEQLDKVLNILEMLR